MQDFMGTFDGMEGQDIFKVIGGAVAGVGLIAALPIFGAIGSVTASGAVLGAALGAGAGRVILPFLGGLKSRGYAAILSFWAGVIPPIPMLGRSLL